MMSPSTPARIRWIAFLFAAISGLFSSTPQTYGDDRIASQVAFFESNIRPVLVDQCYECHNSMTTSEGGLAVDSRDALLKGGDNGQVVVPGEPTKSRLLPILRHEIDGLQMPEGGPKLADETIADFEKWITTGAFDPRDSAPTADEVAEETSWTQTLERRKKWWSFRPIDAPPPPPIKTAAWSSVIDRFIFEQIEQAQLPVAPLASPPTLVRRLFFNLTGLPPSADVARQWSMRIADAGPSGRDAVVGELVNELLDSPQYGERWARHWMDWIRYAESHGSEGDPSIANAWHFRDYLIRALNDDVPYDQLVREHIAGDLLDPPRVNRQLGINESAIGTAHWRMVFHGFAPTDALDEKVRFTDDQINAFSKAFLGLTVSCARCHDHKFDPISQKDYYAFFGILGSCRPGRIAIDLPDQLDKHRDALSNLKHKIRDAIATDWLDHSKQLAKRLAEESALWKQGDQLQHLLHPLHQLHSKSDDTENAWRDLVDRYTQKIDLRKPLKTAAFRHQWDFRSNVDRAEWFSNRTQLPHRAAPAGDFSIAPKGDIALNGIYPAGVYSHLLSQKHTARFTSPEFAVGKDLELWVQVIGEGGSTVRYVVQNYPRNGTVYPVANLQSLWKWQRFDLTYWDGDDIHIELTTAMDAPLLFKNNSHSWFGVRKAVVKTKGQPAPHDSFERFEPIFGAANSGHRKEINQIRIESYEDATRVYHSAIRAAINSWQAGKCSDGEALLLDECMKLGLLPNQLESLPTASSLIATYRSLEEAIPIPTRVPALDETVASNQPLFARGNHKNPTDEVPRRFLEAIDTTPYSTNLSGRLELAEDILRPDNPLARRVIVNRVWHHLFGRGLVSTPDNFGHMGDRPSHPELLDWLVVRFEEQGWSLKKLIREIVTSRTWQLGAESSAKSRDVDPENRLLSHANVRRIEAEAIRDAMLQVSGKLDGTRYGPPTDGKSRRRSVYVRVIRNNLDPFLRVFDFPEPYSTTGRRNVTNVPAQSLTIMNNPHIAGLAKAWADQTEALEVNTDGERVRHMFASAFGRLPTDAEVRLALDYMSETKLAAAETRKQHTRLKNTIAASEASIKAIMQPAREQLAIESDAQRESPSFYPQPIAAWNFDESPKDFIGELHCEPRDGGKIAEGSAVVRDGGYFVSARLNFDLRAKTLEAWVQLDNLDQRGGGVMTIQSPDGVTFDSIVFGEQHPRRWLAGSNGFARTQGFHGVDENDANKSPVHIAITYSDDGNVTGYRNGVRYGKPFASSGPVEFKKGQAVISFGVRHFPNSPGRRLHGSVKRARLYDRALTAEEIAATSSTQSHFVPESKVLSALSENDRNRITTLRSEIAAANEALAELGTFPMGNEQSIAWAELAKALFTFKEFVYIR